MKKRSSHIEIFAVYALFVLFLLGCGGGGGGNTTTTTTSYDNQPTYPVTPQTDNTTPSAKPSAPTGVSVSFLASNTSPGISVSWNKVTDATSYNIYMASACGVTKSNYSSKSDGRKITGIQYTSYGVTSLTQGKWYYFIVTAVNSNGESDASTEINYPYSATWGPCGSQLTSINLLYQSPVSVPISAGQINLTAVFCSFTLTDYTLNCSSELTWVSTTSSVATVEKRSSADSNFYIAPAYIKFKSIGKTAIYAYKDNIKSNEISLEITNAKIKSLLKNEF